MNSRINELDEIINSRRTAMADHPTSPDYETWSRELSDAEAEKTKYIEDHKGIQDRIEFELQENGFALDTMEVDGLTAPEIITDDTQYALIRKGTQALVVNLTTTYLQNINDLKELHKFDIKTVTDRANEAENNLILSQTANKDLEVANYQLGLDNDELDGKVRKGAELLHEANQTIEKLNKSIEDALKKQSEEIKRSLNVPSEPQDTTSFKAGIDASKPRITNVRFKDEHGIDRKTKLATLVLTGEGIEYQEYTEKRYIILDAIQAEQYKADEANKSAEAEQLKIDEANKYPDVAPVTEPTVIVDQVTEYSPSEEDLQAGQSVVEGSPSEVGKLDEKESEVKPIMTNEEIHARFERIERELRLEEYHKQKLDELRDLVA